MSRAEWLQQRHAAWQTPDEIVDGLIRSATGSGIARKERIIQGEANETYRVTDTRGNDVILKIAHGRPHQFGSLDEHVRMLRDAGVIAPEVLLRTVVEQTSGPASVVVQRFLSGVPLLTLVGKIPEDETAALVEETGAMLARFHSVLAPDEPHPFSQQCVKEMEQDMPGAEAGLRAHGFDPDEIRTLVVGSAALLDRWPQCLVHGDYGPDHIIVNDGHVGGVIDLDMACAGVPVVDISWWDTFFDRPPHTSASLVTGYERVAPLGEHERARVTYSLASSVGKIQYFIEQAHPGGADFMARNITKWIEALKR